MKNTNPKKKLVSAVLALAAVSALSCPTASAAQSTQSIGLSEVYSLVGGEQEMKAHSAMEYVEESYWPSPVVADLDHDGKLEVINAAYTLTVADAATGKVKWWVNAGKDRSTAHVRYTEGTSANPAGRVYCDFIVEDLDGDGFQEIVIGYEDGSVSVLDSWGYFKPGWPQKVTDSSVRALAVGDVDGDGKKEIAVGMGVNDTKSIWVYRCDGSIQPGWPQLNDAQNGLKNHSTTGTAYGEGLYSNGITMGDLDGDGLPEILMTTDNPYVVAYNGDGTLVGTCDTFENRAWGKVAFYEDYDVEKACPNEGWGWSLAIQPNKTRADLYRAELGHSAIAYSDVDGDGTSEVIVTALMMDVTNSYTNTSGTNSWATLADTRYMSVYILNQDRTRYTNPAKGFDWTTIPTELNSSVSGTQKKQDAESMACGVLSEPVCADLDGDGNQEILFSSFDGMVHCFSLNKTEWAFKLPQTTSSIYEFATTPVCADLNGDGKLEVIFASWTDTDNAAGTRTYVDGALYILDCKGNLITKHKLHEALFEADGVKSDNTAYAAPTVADIDGDGILEILVNTRHYGLCAYKATPGATTVEQPLALANDMRVSIDGGSPIILHTYVLRDANGDTNYVKIRDLAQVLTASVWGLRFNITWSAANGTNLIPGQEYQSIGGEWILSFVGNQPYRRNTSYTLKVNGKTVQLDAIILTDSNGGDNTYCKLRDLGDALGTFNVGWRGSDRTALINSK